MSLPQEQVACLCTVKANLEETREHHTLQEAIVARCFLIPCLFDDHVILRYWGKFGVDDAGPGAANTELSEVKESRPKLEENAYMLDIMHKSALPAAFWNLLQEEVACPLPANTVKIRIKMKDEGACARSVKTEQSGLEDEVACLCTAKANLDETIEHHKSEEDAVKTELSAADEKYRKLEDEVAALRSAQAELRQVSDRYHKLEESFQMIAGLRAVADGKRQLPEAQDEVTGRSSETGLELRQLEDEVTGLRESNAVLREAYDTLKAAFRPFREGPELVSEEDSISPAPPGCRQTLPLPEQEMSQPVMQKPRCVAEVQPLREAGLFVDLCPAPPNGPGTLEAGRHRDKEEICSMVHGARSHP
ncbi:NLRC3 [Symbiodinium sp. CCMP2592]|nr:NLRC3 [Symbiodinium sp. CCMP2592]